MSGGPPRFQEHIHWEACAQFRQKSVPRQRPFFRL